MKHTYLSKGFPDMFSTMVAEAAMELPSLTKENDMDFIRFATARVMEAFWENYASTCTMQAQQELAGLDEKDGDKMNAWFEKYANFASNEECADRAEMVLADLDAKLPTFLQEEYNAFHNRA